MRLTSPRGRAATIACAIAAAWCSPARAAGDGEGAPVGPIPVSASFSVAERATIVGVTVTGVLALALAPRIFQPDPSFGPPGPDSLDRRVSNALYTANGTGARFLGGVPDAAGLYVIPYLPALFYAGETAILAHTGQPARGLGFESRDWNPQHRLWAYVEALGWTALITGVTKVAVGRLRPYVVLDHPALAASSWEDRLSFYSSHASGSFCAASFVALDVSHALRAGPLSGASPARRWILGILVPYAAAFGVAGLVGVSRIVDQQHWLTDVVVGAAVGTAAAHIAYFAHFDGLGQPRRRFGSQVLAAPSALGIAPIPGGVALTGLLP